MASRETLVQDEMTAIVLKEGHYHVSGVYYNDEGNAARQRRWEAERRVDREIRFSRQIHTCGHCKGKIERAQDLDIHNHGGELLEVHKPGMCVIDADKIIECIFGVNPRTGERVFGRMRKGKTVIVSPTDTLGAVA